MNKASFGSIISGTANPDDLIPAFVCELIRLRGALPIDIRKHLRKYDAGSHDSDESELVHDLIDALGEFAPAYGYFGGHHGDPADFGFWLDQDALSDFDGLRVNDPSEIPDKYTGEVLYTNDHGNLTLYCVSKRGKFREVWSLV